MIWYKSIYIFPKTVVIWQYESIVRRRASDSRIFSRHRACRVACAPTDNWLILPDHHCFREYRLTCIISFWPPAQRETFLSIEKHFLCHTYLTSTRESSIWNYIAHVGSTVFSPIASCIVLGMPCILLQYATVLCKHAARVGPPPPRPVLPLACMRLHVSLYCQIAARHAAASGVISLAPLRATKFWSLRLVLRYFWTHGEELMLMGHYIWPLSTFFFENSQCL